MGCIERFHNIKDQLLDIIECELEKDVRDINTHELYEVIDMAKDMTEMCRNNAEYKYYWKVVESMESGSEDKYLKSAHDPSIISRMYFEQPPEYASLKHYEELVDSKANEAMRKAEAEAFVKELIEDIHSLGMTPDEKGIIKQHIANM